MLFFWGGLDSHIPPESTQKVAAARARQESVHQVEFSFADHGFFCDQRASYNSEAAVLAWPLTLALFEQHIAGKATPAGA